jgi:hypothetical protein
MSFICDMTWYELTSCDNYGLVFQTSFKTSQDSNFQSGNPLGNVGTHFLTIVGMCLNLKAFSSPTSLVMC